MNLNLSFISIIFVVTSLFLCSCDTKQDSVYKISLNTEAKEQSPHDSIQPIVTEAMMQLMNTYQSMGKPNECVGYLDSLYRYNTSGAQYVTSLLGTLYRRAGKLSDAIDLYLESRRLAQEKKDAQGEAAACNALAELYLYWDIPAYSNRYASQAIALNGEQPRANLMIATQSLLLKGQIMLELGHPDSALHYYDKAGNACRTLPYASGQADVDYLNGAFRVERCMGDSLQEGMEVLRRVIAEGTSLLQAKAFYKLAVAHFRQQQKNEAGAMLDSMYRLLHRFDSPQYIEVDYEWVLKHYLEKKDLPHVEQYVTDLIEECKFNFNSDICTKMYENIVNLQTEAEQQQLKFEQLELENDRLYYRIWFFSSFAAILILSVWIIYKKRLSQAKQELMETRLSSLMDKLEEAQRNKEKVEQKLSEVTLHKEAAEQQLSDMFTHKESREEIMAVTPSVLQEVGENDFRRRFERLYPRFLPVLRGKVPTIGRKEELTCMLIVLGQDTHQIATIMGIAYKSTNMARWRLRQKLGLDTGESLDDFIKALAE